MVPIRKCARFTHLYILDRPLAESVDVKTWHASNVAMFAKGGTYCQGNVESQAVVSPDSKPSAKIPSGAQ